MRKIFLLFCLLTAGKCVICQTLPAATCGILYTYDNAGNRTKQEYLCTAGRSINTTLENNSTVQNENSESTAFVKVDAIYPNPNDGRFAIRFEPELKSADVIITDATGKRVSHFKSKGKIVQFDISDEAAGTYFVIVRDGKTKVTQKVIKQY